MRRQGSKQQFAGSHVVTTAVAMVPMQLCYFDTKNVIKHNVSFELMKFGFFKIVHIK